MNEILAARIAFEVFFACLLGGVLLLPRAYVFRGARDGARWRDLRVWGVALVILHSVVYWIF
jgi:hypothetical protein